MPLLLTSAEIKTRVEITISINVVSSLTLIPVIVQHWRLQSVPLCHAEVLLADAVGAIAELIIKLLILVLFKLAVQLEIKTTYFFKMS